MLLLVLHTEPASLLPGDEAGALVDLSKGLESAFKELMLEPRSSAGNRTSRSLAGWHQLLQRAVGSKAYSASLI